MKIALKNRAMRWVGSGAVLAAVAGVFVVVLSGGSPPEKSRPGAAPHGADAVASQEVVRVKTIRPKREPLKVTITEPAHVEPYEMADLHAKVAGYLQKVHVDIGDRVKKDQVLAELWLPEMEQELRQKRALVLQAQAELKLTKEAVAVAEADRNRLKSQYERLTKIGASGVIDKEIVEETRNGYEVSKAKWSMAQADVGVKEARLEVAEANLEHARIMLDYGKIRAPYDGVITQRLVHPGAFIQSAAAGKTGPLLTIARTERMRIVTAISEAQSASIRLGQPATLTVGALRGQQFHGKVARLADALDRKSRTMLVESDLDRPAAGLRPGMYGSLTITLADHAEALLLPTSALVAGNKPCVWCVEGGRAVRREIDIGYNDGTRVQITGGLSSDARVITDGKTSVREGQAVEAVE